ncbi:MAG: GyrI-like domain-containing protein [Rhodocyclaceae bacterium]|nr:GyrI-like domain-containing protein [Rhodocyclaceae bacterium]
MSQDGQFPQPEFVNAQETPLVALAREFDPDSRADIPGLWAEFFGCGWVLPGDEEPACYGVSYNVRPDGRFSYAVGRNVDPLPEALPEGACVVTLSPGRHAVFRARGGVQEIPALFDAIFGSWLPQSGETLREGAVFERYPFDEDSSPESMAYEIWVPVAG